MKIKKSQYWNLLYATDINTIWTNTEPDPLLKSIVLRDLKKITKKNIHVLDLGCGNGRNSRIFDEFENFDLQFTGIDFSEAAIKHCQKTYMRKNFICCDISNDIFPLVTKHLDPAKKYFDLILDHGCFHCILPGQRHRYLENILKISSKGTLFFLDVWFESEKRESDKLNRKPDFLPLENLDEWFVSIEDINEIFGQQFRVANYIIDKSPPHDINNGVMYCTLIRK